MITTMMMIEVMMIEHHLNERKSQRRAVKRRIIKRKRVVAEAANGIESILMTVAVVADRMQMLIEEEMEKRNEVMMIPMKKRRERKGRDHQDIMIQIAVAIAIPAILRGVMTERKPRRERNTNPKSPQRDNDDGITFHLLKDDHFIMNRRPLSLAVFYNIRYLELNIAFDMHRCSTNIILIHREVHIGSPCLILPLNLHGPIRIQRRTNGVVITKFPIPCQ